MEIKHYNINGVNTTFIKTNKFKTITIEIIFLGEFSKEIATKKSLLSRVLTNSTKKYDTKKKVAEKLYDLYDASIGLSVYPSYKTSITGFHLDFINENNIASGSNLTKDAISFLNEVIFHPNVEENAFEPKIFLEEKRNLEDKIKNIYNNKNRYAFKKLLQHMCQGEIHSVSSLGEMEDLQSITAKDLYDTYLDMIQNEQTSIYVMGDFNDEEMLENLKLMGPFPRSEYNYELNSMENKYIDEVRDVIEEQEISQSKLCIGFRTNTENVGKGLYSLLLMNSIFGGMYSSDLFRVIREENSLCYAIASQVIASARLLFVTAGIDRDKKEFAVELIQKQVEEYKNGNVNEDLLEIAKDSLINELREIEDSPSSYINHILRNSLNKTEYSIEDIVDIIKNVEIEDIKKVASKIELDTIYFLTNKKVI